MPEIVLSREEIAEVHRLVLVDPRATQCRIAWDPNTDQTNVRLYDAWGCLIGVHEVKAPAPAPREDELIYQQTEGIE